VGDGGQFRCVQDALKVVWPGDRLVLLSPETEPFSVDRPLTISGRGHYIKAVHALAAVQVEEAVFGRMEAAPGASLALQNCRGDGVTARGGAVKLAHCHLWGRGLEGDRESRIVIDHCRIEKTELGVRALGESVFRDTVFVHHPGAALTVGAGGSCEMNGCSFEENGLGVHLFGSLEGKNNRFQQGGTGIRGEGYSRVFLRRSEFFGLQTGLHLAGEGELDHVLTEETELGLGIENGGDVFVRHSRFQSVQRALEVRGQGRLLHTKILGAEQGGVFVDEPGTLWMEGCRVRKSAPGLVSLSPKVYTRGCVFWDNRVGWKLPDPLRA